VSAVDKATGKEQSIRVEASSGLTEEEIEKMKEDAEKHAEEDKKRKERAETINEANSMVYTTQQNLEEYGDKIPDDKRGPIEDALERVEDELETAEADEPVDSLEDALEDLNEKWSAASQEIYAAQQQEAEQGQPGAAGAAGAGAGAAAGASPGDGAQADEDGDVHDADYEVVDEGEDE
jgi:molecular chaperone DnaK